MAAHRKGAKVAWPCLSWGREGASALGEDVSVTEAFFASSWGCAQGEPRVFVSGAMVSGRAGGLKGTTPLGFPGTDWRWVSDV